MVVGSYARTHVVGFQQLCALTLARIKVMVSVVVSAISRIFALFIMVMMECPFEHYIGYSHVKKLQWVDALVGSESP